MIGQLSYHTAEQRMHIKTIWSDVHSVQYAEKLGGKLHDNDMYIISNNDNK